MHSIQGRLTGALLVATATIALMAGAPTRPASDLRVCADPYDMPFSNSQGEGFENKIAQVVARDLNATVINYWWPSRRGVLRNSILGGFCDVMIQAPVGLDPVATTKPYYRSTYYFVFRADRGLQLRSLDDTLLKRLKIGVNMIGYDYTNTPPAHALGSRGIVGLVGFGNFLNPDPKADHPDDIIKAVARIQSTSPSCGDLWRAYWAKQQPVPLTMVALPDSDAVSGMPFAFSMAMAVRHRDKALKATLDSVIDRRHGEITEILRQYNVPMIEMRRSGAPPAGTYTQRGRRDVRTKHFVRGGLVGAWITAAVVMAWAPAGGQRAAAAAPRDTCGTACWCPIPSTRGGSGGTSTASAATAKTRCARSFRNAPDLRWAVSPTGANFPREQLLQHRLERPAHQGHARLERAARFSRGDQTRFTCT